MLVGVGYSDNPDTEAAGLEAVRQAMARAGENRPCDLVMLFATNRHDLAHLRSVVAALAGPAACIVGGGAIGVVTNNRLGHSGDQVGLALFWLGEIGCQALAVGGMEQSEEDAGLRLGAAMSASGVQPETSALLFYDAIDRSGGRMRLHLATPLLQGLEYSLGFLPNLVGAGLMGDYECSDAPLLIGADVAAHHAILLTFYDRLRISSTILHGCRPASDYLEVTAADGQTVLKINGRPAIPFIESMTGMPAEEFPFYMIFGVNHGDPAAPFNDDHYANRLCFDIDRARGGIVMFESDMVAGTRFQVMYRSLDFEYIAPKIDQAFAQLDGRRPVFAFYIDCAGRTAKNSNTEHEDAAIVQAAVAGRVPLLGIYSGVEIAPVMGISRTLDWTGVFCLFSVAE